ncbi:ocellar opsin, partial [Octopus bimaculoides]
TATTTAAAAATAIAAVGEFTGGAVDDLDPYTIWNPEKAYAARGICLILFGTFGVLLNVFIIVAIVPNRRLRTVRNILLVHLGLIGLASSITLTLYAAVVIFHGVWIGGRSACHAYGFILSVFTFASIWTITALSWDKYRTIASPLHHSLSASFRKMAGCFILFWLGAVSLSVPPLTGYSRFIFDKNMAICTVELRASTDLWYSLVYLSSAFLLPFVLITYCYLHIFRIARNQSSRIAATMVRMVSVIQAPISSAPQAALSIKGTKAISTILQLTGAFAFTYLPYSMILLFKMLFTSSHMDNVTVVLATTLFQAAPLTNAAVYGIRNKILRSSFNRYARRKMQEFCYRDHRRSSIRSVTKRQPSALKLSLLQGRRCVTSGVILPTYYSGASGSGGGGGSGGVRGGSVGAGVCSGVCCYDDADGNVGGNTNRHAHGLRRTQSYPIKTLTEVNGLSIGMSRTITGPYQQHSLVNLNDINSLTPIE